MAGRTKWSPCEPTMPHISKDLVRLTGNSPVKIALKIKDLLTLKNAEGILVFYEQPGNVFENKWNLKGHSGETCDVIENKLDTYM